VSAASGPPAGPDPSPVRAGAVVVGAGLAGLAAAATLRRAGVGDVRVLEAGPAVGGVVRSERLGPWLLEHGPNTLRVAGPARAALADLGVEPLLVPAAPASRLRFLFHEGRLVPLPMGPAAAVRTPLVSWRGKLRILAEPFVGRGDPTGETVDAFVSRRLGAEASERLVGPFLTGVYAGDERALGAEAVFPSLVEAERRSGSIVRGMLARRRAGVGAPAALPGIHSTPEGLGAIARHLAAGLGESLATGVPVAAVARDGAGWRVQPERGGEALWSERVVVATPAREAAALLRGADADLARMLAAIDHAPIVVMHAGADPEGARHPVAGFGFLVPRAAGLGLLGCLFLSNLFPGRAPAGRALLTCMLGGTRWREAVTLPDDALVARLHADLDATLGLAAAPETLRIVRWPRAVPQPGPDHPRAVARMRGRLEGSGLELAGAYLEGVAVPDTLASGVRAAWRLLGRQTG